MSDHQLDTTAPGGTDRPTTVAVYVGTFRRNEPLQRLLESVTRAVVVVASRAEVAMIVVDDNPDGSARPVVDRFEREHGEQFALGVHYRHVGQGNISLVRNAGLAVGLDLAEWVAMTDDDCEVTDGWLAELLNCQERTGADAVTGPCVLVIPDTSPRWLTDQPFLDEGLMSAPDGANMPVAATHNSMVRSAWFRDRPDIRFDSELGVLGGEDMVLFRRAADEGLSIRFAKHAVVHAHEGPERTTFGYRVAINYWLGNTMSVTNLALGSASRARLVLRGAKLALSTVVRPFGRMVRGRAPQWRFTAALLAQSSGLVTGALGLRRPHH